MLRRILAVLGLLAATFAAHADSVHFLQDIHGPQDPSQFIARENTLRREINSNFMLGDGGNPSLPSARLNLGVGIPISVIDFGAQHDAKTYADGVITAGTPDLHSASANFTVQDEKKIVQIDGAGMGGVTGAPFSTTILTFVDAHHVILAANAPATTPLSYFAAASVATTGTAGSYVPGETVTITGGTSTVQAVGKVQDTKVRTAAINAAGTLGTDGACVLQGTTGVGTYFVINATIAGGAISALGSFTGVPGAGHYLTNPTSLAAEPITNATGYNCAPTGATLTLTMGAEVVSVQTAGSYSVVPANSAATGAGSISGATGLTLDISWNASGSFVYGTDDAPALTAAINKLAFNYAAGILSYVYAPAGAYLINGPELPTMRTGGGIIGEGTGRTYFIFGSDYVGDLFSWSEAWWGANGINVSPINGPVDAVTLNAAGPKAIGFSVTGNRRAAGQQNALMFYDRNDAVLINDIDVLFTNGRCIGVGTTKFTTKADQRESRWSKIRCYDNGQTGVPTVEISSNGAGADGADEISIDDLDIYAPYDKGVWVHNVDASGVRNIRFGRLRIEGLQWNAANVAADLLVVGDPVNTGSIHDIYFENVEIIDPYTGQYGLTITGPSAAAQPYQIQFTGAFGGGIPLGGGVNVVAGRLLYINILGMFSWGVNIKQAAAPEVGVPFFLNGYGAEQNWTYSTAFPRSLVSNLHRGGQPGPNAYISSSLPDTTVLGGNDRGVSSVDLQTARIHASEVASGSMSVIGGGTQNSASALQATISGGFANLLTGVQTAIPGGVKGWDYGLTGGLFYSSNCLHQGRKGSCQASILVLGAETTSVTPKQMTSNLLAADSTNCVNIPTASSWNVKLQIVARNTNSTNIASWRSISGLLYREGANAFYVGQATGATTPDDALGTGSTATIQLSADTTNQCLNVSWTAPNTDAWNVTARVDMVSVQ
jgi:hypothetical protein